MTFVFIDTETTGLNPAKHQVWEAAYAVGEDGPVLHSLLTHDAGTADPAAMHMNNYLDRAAVLNTQEALVNALRFEGAFKAALQGATLVGANPAFDAAFLNARWGESPWHYRLLDVEAYAMPILGYDSPRGLAAIYTDLTNLGHEIYTPDHTARADVLCVRDCFRILRNMADEMRAA
jgi:oligoribonuclease (3'-5' exoribonuclease)